MACSGIAVPFFFLQKQQFKNNIMKYKCHRNQETVKYTIWIIMRTKTTSKVITYQLSGKKILVKKMSVSLQIALAAETHVADGMTLKSQSSPWLLLELLNTTYWLRFWSHLPQCIAQLATNCAVSYKIMQYAGVGCINRYRYRQLRSEHSVRHVLPPVYFCLWGLFCSSVRHPSAPSV
jgi:hypothetical protein